MALVAWLWDKPDVLKSKVIVGLGAFALICFAWLVFF